MAATPRQNLDAESRFELAPVAEDGTGPGVIGARAFVHLWLLLMILGAVAVLAVSIPTPLYASGLAALDPALAGLLDLAT